MLDGNEIYSAGSTNAGQVDDPFIQQKLEKLRLVQPRDRDLASGEWPKLDEYAAKKAYLAVIGAQQVPKLMSDRIDFHAAVIHPSSSATGAPGRSDRAVLTHDGRSDPAARADSRLGQYRGKELVGRSQ